MPPTKRAHRISSTYSILCRMSHCSWHRSTVTRNQARFSSGVPARRFARSKQQGCPQVTTCTRQASNKGAGILLL